LGVWEQTPLEKSAFREGIVPKDENHPEMFPQKFWAAFHQSFVFTNFWGETHPFSRSFKEELVSFFFRVHSQMSPRLRRELLKNSFGGKPTRIAPLI